MALQTFEWDPVATIRNPSDAGYLLEAALENSTVEHVAAALQICAQARGGTAKLAAEAHVDAALLESAISAPGPHSYAMASSIRDTFLRNEARALVA